MKNLISMLFLCMCETVVSQSYPICASDIFTTDSSKVFIITEIKPIGNNPFVELWNCRQETYFFEMIYLESISSQVVDSVSQVTVYPNNFLILPLPDGLYKEDALRISVKRGTRIDTMWGLVYLIKDSSHSMSMCDRYRETLPTPGFGNDCSPPLSIRETFHAQEIYHERVIMFDFLGRKLFQGVFSQEIEKEFSNRLVILYLEKTKQAFKLFNIKSDP